MHSDSARLEVGALSETGYVRDENQDRMSGAQVPLGHLYIVADGMGGHKAGAVAAEMAVQELQRSLSEALRHEPIMLVLEGAFHKANDLVYQKAHCGDPETENMGTTAVLLLISDDVARVAHVGDSRAYLYRNGTLTQWTTDHTVVQKMVDAGMLRPEEAAAHPNASMLERAIGTGPNIEIDIREETLKTGDAILLCSDGLSGYVSDTEIAAVLRSGGTVQETTEALVRSALEKGGKDNVTVQLIQYGTRKETQTAGQTQPLKELPQSSVSSGPAAPQREALSRRTLTALAISGLVLASLSGVFYFNGREAARLEPNVETAGGSEREPEVSVGAPENPAKEGQSLKGEAAAEKKSTKAGVAELQKDLEDARAARATAAKQAEELAKQLTAQKQSAKAAAAKAQKELQAAVAAKENALTEAKKLRQKLESTERELQQARRRLEDPAKANPATSAQHEAVPNKSGAGTAPAGSTGESAPPQ